MSGHVFKLRGSCLAILGMALFIAIPAGAEPAGNALFVYGSVTVERAPASPLKKGEPLFAGDTIVTGSRSRAQLLMKDGAKVALRPDTRFVINEYFEAGDEIEAPDGSVVVADKGGSVTSLIKGGFRTITGAIGDNNPEGFEARTPVATLGIRGTDFIAVFCNAATSPCTTAPGLPEGDAPDDGLYVGASDGNVVLSNEAGSLEISPGQYAYVKEPDAVPQKLPGPPPVIYANAAVSGGDAEEGEAEAATEEAVAEEAGAAEETAESDETAQAQTESVAEDPASPAEGEADTAVAAGDEAAADEGTDPAVVGGETATAATSGPGADGTTESGTVTPDSSGEASSTQLTTESTAATAATGDSGTADPATTDGTSATAATSGESTADPATTDGTTATAATSGDSTADPTTTDSTTATAATSGDSTADPATTDGTTATAATSDSGTAGPATSDGTATTDASPDSSSSFAATSDSTSGTQTSTDTSDPFPAMPVSEDPWTDATVLIGSETEDTSIFASETETGTTTTTQTTTTQPTRVRTTTTTTPTADTTTSIMQTGGEEVGSGDLSFAAPQEPAIEIVATDEFGTPIDLIDGDPEPTLFNDVAFATGSLLQSASFTGVSSNIPADLTLGQSGASLRGFKGPSPGAPDPRGSRYAIGDAASFNVGFDPLSGIRWGRWSAGTAALTPPGASATGIQLAQQSLHWVLGPQLDAPPVLPISGTVSFEVISGNTDPTDNFGNVGVLGSASLLADFTNQTVIADVLLSMAGSIWSGNGSGALNGHQFGGDFSTVLIDNLPGAGGRFSGFLAGGSQGGFDGAGLGYALEDLDGSVVNGVVVFGPPRP